MINIIYIISLVGSILAIILYIVNYANGMLHFLDNKRAHIVVYGQFIFTWFIIAFIYMTLNK